MAMSMPIERKLIFGPRAVEIVRCQNKDDLELWAGDVVVLDTSNTSATNICVKVSNTSDDVDVYGMAIQHIPVGSYGEIQRAGPTSILKADGNANISEGDEISVIDGASYTDYTDADVTFTNDSTAVVGNGTVFTSAMKGRYIYKDSASTKYRITTVSDTTNLVITPAYREVTGSGASYTITPEGVCQLATAGKGGAFGTSLESYTTNDSFGTIAVVLFHPNKVDTTVTGNTLDVAYDEGGAGAGRTITVDTNAVVLAGDEAAQNILEITNTAGNGALIDLTHTTTSSNDIDGTGSSWSVTGAGAMTVVSLDSGSGLIQTTGNLEAAGGTFTGNVAMVDITASGTITGTIASASWASPTFTGTVTVSGATTFATTVTMNGNLTMGASETITITGAADSTVFTITAGDAVITDGTLSVSNTDDTTTMVTLDHSGGNLASGSEVLKLDDGGNTQTGAAMLAIEPTGTPQEGSFGINFVGGGLTMQALKIDCDSATNSSVLINNGGGLSGDKATLELTLDASASDGASILYVNSTTACSATVYGINIKCDASNLEALWIEKGLSKFDEPIRLADGTVSVPSLAFTSDIDTGIFWASTYIGFAVAGAEEMQIAANLITIGAAANLKFTTSTTGILDGAGLQLLTFVHTGTAVDEFTITNAAQNGEVILETTGDDADITMQLKVKGDAPINIVEGTAGDAARPSIILNSDVDSGLYGTADTLGLSTNGSEAIGIDSSQVVTFSGDFVLSGHKQSQVFHCNNFHCPVPATEWKVSATGADIPASQTGALMWIPLDFLKVGDEIVLYRIVGDSTDTGATTLDCKLVRIAKADPPTTNDVAGGAITQVALNGVFDVEKTLTSPEIVPTDSMYNFEVAATTAGSDSFRVIGIEVQVNRK